ncbi:MAG TPA: hypothetical protein VLL97_14630 [Acidobacteriota bacterium]|nr:hypothetical protein [Acidobacteriota bacterium]
MTIVYHAVCAFCGCACDDIELHIEGDRITKAVHACSLGRSWFLNHHASADYPAALIDGKPAPLEEAVAATADYLLNADYPFIYGLSNMTCEAQGAAVKLAESLQGAIDSHSSL